MNVSLVHVTFRVFIHSLRAEDLNAILKARAQGIEFWHIILLGTTMDVPELLQGTLRNFSAGATLSAIFFSVQCLGRLKVSNSQVSFL